MNDQEFEKYLETLRSKTPSDQQVSRWKQAVEKEAGRKTKRPLYWSQMAAALIAGFIMGALAFSRTGKQMESVSLAKNESENATIEYIYTKY